MITVRIPKDSYNKMRTICKRRTIDSMNGLEEAIRDWIKKWEIPEDWEDLTKKTESKVIAKCRQM